MMYDYNLINLNNLKNYSVEEIIKFLRFNGIKKFDECDIESLKKIIDKIVLKNQKDFNISYVVERLDKEFDLVKLDESTIIDIELKTSKRDVEQCIENYKLLKNEYDNREVIVYCYESEYNHIYLLNYKDKKFVLTSFEQLNDDLSKIEKGIKLNVNINVASVYLNPSFYFDKKYNLSSSQKLTKNQILRSDKKINIIGGRAGCGKSLLALDLYDYYKGENKVVCYLAPFKYKDVINKELRNKINIKTVKDFLSTEENVDILIIDEAQRLKKDDIVVLPNFVKEKLILIGDLNQNIDYEHSFEELYNDKVNHAVYNMKQLIRTDDTFDIYARKILNLPDKGFKHKKIDKEKIKIVMFGEENDDLSDYVFIEPSKSLHFQDCVDTCSDRKCFNISKRCKNKKEPHTVISSEYSKVVLYLCNGFDIQDGNIVAVSKLCTGKLSSQLYSIITRTVDHLMVVTDNIALYNFMMEKLEEM